MASRKVIIRVVQLSVSALLFLYLLGIIPILDPRFRTSDFAAYQPEMETSFDEYIAQNESRIRGALATHYYSKDPWPFGPDYPLEKVVRMRAPFEIAPDQNRCNPGSQSRGFLLVHGLTHSPYLLSELASSLTGRFPCAWIRSLLMPGHGTVPGDLLSVRLQDWQQVVSYGVTSFENIVDELYIVGYSSGAALAIDFIQEHPGNTLVSGLVLLSPGLATAQTGISLAGYLKYLVRWVGRGSDRDPVKYDSIPTNAVAQFYQVTRRVTDPGLPPIRKPVFMVTSGEDTTVNTPFAANYFCAQVDSKRRKLIWYRSQATGSMPDVDCEGLQIVDSAMPAARYISHSHVAISMPPENEHYGVNGNYPICNAYNEDPQLFESCVSDHDGTVYGEYTLPDESGFYQGRVLRRASFNPQYNDMFDALSCFIEQTCEEDDPRQSLGFFKDTYESYS